VTGDVDVVLMEEAFRAAGRTLFSLSLVKGTEGNLSTFDGVTLVITRAGAALDELARVDLAVGTLDGDLDGASSDLAVHRRFYAERGAGALVHAHPAGTVPAGEVTSGKHGVYVFASSLERAVELAARHAREQAQGSGASSSEAVGPGEKGSGASSSEAVSHGGKGRV
jgi:ribulose-5-phosphate 4-epimerase/fuculose-1-phosphate aldolase